MSYMEKSGSRQKCTNRPASLDIWVDLLGTYLCLDVFCRENLSYR